MEYCLSRLVVSLPRIEWMSSDESWQQYLMKKQERMQFEEEQASTLDQEEWFYAKVWLDTVTDDLDIMECGGYCHNPGGFQPAAFTHNGLGDKAGSFRNNSSGDRDNSTNSLTKTGSTGPSVHVRVGSGRTSAKNSTKIHIPSSSPFTDKELQNAVANPNPNFFGSGSGNSTSTNHSRQTSAEDSGRRCSHEVRNDSVHAMVKSPSGDEVPQAQTLFEELGISGEDEKRSNMCQACRDVREFYRNTNRYISSMVLGNTEYVKLKLKYDMDRQESKSNDQGEKTPVGNTSVGAMLRKSVGDLPLTDSVAPKRPGNHGTGESGNNEEMDIQVPRMQSSGIFKDAEEEPLSVSSVETSKGQDKKKPGPSFQMAPTIYIPSRDEPPDLENAKSMPHGNARKSAKSVSSPSPTVPVFPKPLTRNDSNPPSKRICYLEFAKSFEVDYQLDKPQRLRIQLFRLIGDNHHREDMLRDMKSESLRSARIFKCKDLSDASSDDLETLRNPSDLPLTSSDYELNKHELVAEASISTTSMYVHSTTELQNNKTSVDSISLFSPLQNPAVWRPLNENPNVYGALMNYRFPLDAYPALLLSDHSPKAAGPASLLLKRESSTELMDVRGVLAFHELDIAARYAVFSLNIEELSIPPSVKIKDSINTVFYKTTRSLSSKDRSDPNDPSVFGGTALGGYNPKWKDMVRIIMFRPLNKGTPIQWMRIHETELRAPNGGAVEFPEFHVSMLRLNNGDYAREIRFELHKLSIHEGFVKVGVVTTTLVDMLRARKKKIRLAIESPDDKKRKIGVIVIRRVSTMIAPSYLEYQKAEVVVSDMPLFVDFTASNQDSSLSESFHYVSDPGNLTHTQNEYERAMKCIYQIVSPYANHRVCPFGFGAKLPPRWHLSHCFRLIASEDKSVSCESFQHLLMSYRYGLKNCVFSGPTLFSHVVRMLRLRAERYQMFKIPIYSFAFLLAESTMSDQLDLIQELIDISGLPISIVIVGIGKASKFAGLETLVRCIHPDSGYSHTLRRNMLQFVRLDDLDDTNQRTVSGDGSSSGVLPSRMDDSINTEYFRPLREACAEMPYQFMEYMMDADWSIDRCRMAWSASNLERHVPELWRQSGQFGSIQSLVRADFELKLVNASAVFLPSSKADRERPVLRLADDHIEKAGRKFKFPV